MSLPDQNTTEHRSIFFIHCPLCNWSVTLPRQSPLGTYAGSDYQSTSLWPITFLCTARQQVSECSSAAIQSEVTHAHVPLETPAALWQIVGECGQEGCRGRCAVYTWYVSQADTDAVVNLTLRLNPTISCSGNHNMQWRAEKMEAVKFDF